MSIHVRLIGIMLKTIEFIHRIIKFDRSLKKTHLVFGIISIIILIISISNMYSYGFSNLNSTCLLVSLLLIERLGNRAYKDIIFSKFVYEHIYKCIQKPNKLFYITPEEFEPHGFTREAIIKRLRESPEIEANKARKGSIAVKYIPENE